QVSWFSVEAENFESIHNHSAYAAVELDRRDDQQSSASIRP
ncbi:MAG: GTP cyclohydrolase, FolE2/MptA family, partial [Geobacter sp.]